MELVKENNRIGKYLLSEPLKTRINDFKIL